MTAPFPPLEALLPHRRPMLLLDEVVSAGEEEIACRVVIRPDSTFCEGGAVPGLIAVEYMAQAVGAWAGLRARALGRPVQIGYLLGSRDLALPARDFRVGDELLVEARHQFGDDALGAFDARVLLRGEVVASGTLNVYQGGGGVP